MGQKTYVYILISLSVSFAKNSPNGPDMDTSSPGFKSKIQEITIFPTKLRESLDKNGRLTYEDLFERKSPIKKEDNSSSLEQSEKTIAAPPINTLPSSAYSIGLFDNCQATVVNKLLLLLS